ncbi:MAG TPA: 2-oxo acid dehydrogenase subunit E2 [Isosphaeraceae bacterium]|jgi:pyruvate/2-oxoglutarate dehydrogenase complex dihydrolipoamide acyltransferase (E2) component
MSDSTRFEFEVRNKFFEANRRIVESEICPAHTVSFAVEVDLTEVERVRARAPGPRKPSYTAFVVKAVALALKEFPYANRRVCRRVLAGHRLQRFHHRDVAVAIERDISGSEATAFLDIIRDADEMPLSQVTERLRELAVCDVTTNKQWAEFSKVIRGLPCWLSALLIRLPWLVPGLWDKWRGGSVLISSPAKYGVDAVIGTWPHPLGVSFGLAKPRPVVRDGEVVACPTFTLTLSFDRRIMAGAQSARFFHRIIEALERAETELATVAASAAVPVPMGARATAASQGVAAAGVLAS